MEPCLPPETLQKYETEQRWLGAMYGCGGYTAEGVPGPRGGHISEEEHHGYMVQLALHKEISVRNQAWYDTMCHNQRMKESSLEGMLLSI